MADTVKAAFESAILLLPVDAILPLRQVGAVLRGSVKYRRIASSIAEVGVIEPLVVAKPKGQETKHLLLDGHLRLAILVEMGEVDVRCLVSSDDEAFTYNKRVNRLATVQEHYMIVRALERGVPEEKLAKALDVDVSLIWRRRNLLDGICAEVVELLKDKQVNPATFEILRKMKSPRQIETAELMAMAGNFSSSYAKALLAATRQHDLLHPDRPKRVGGISPEQMARMEREMETLQRDFKSFEASYGDDVLNLVVATSYLSKLLANSEIERYLSSRYPEFIEGFKVIITAASLDECTTSG